jgi:hypothetical protein
VKSKHSVLPACKSKKHWRKLAAINLSSTEIFH